MSAMLVTVHAVGRRACPPPEWAFWRYTDGTDGAPDFARVAG